MAEVVFVDYILIYIVVSKYMISKKQIKEYITSAVESFREVMPPVDVPYPEIRIASAAILKKVRAELLEVTGSTNFNVAEPYTSVMETRCVCIS